MHTSAVSEQSPPEMLLMSSATNFSRENLKRLAGRQTKFDQHGSPDICQPIVCYLPFTEG